MDKKREHSTPKPYGLNHGRMSALPPMECVVMCLLAFLLSTRVVLQKRKGRASEGASSEWPVDGLTFILAS